MILRYSVSTGKVLISIFTILRFQAGILGYSIAGMKAFEGKFSYKNQLFS